MSGREQISNYLKSFSRYLASLSSEDAAEVIQEIESHIYDVIDQQEMAGKEANIESILAGLGAPRVLAENYVSHIQQGTPPPKGFRPLTSVTKGLSKTLYWGMMAFGYGTGLALIALAFANLLLPNGIAFWVEAEGNSVAIGFLSNPILANSDATITGLWITPVALVSAYAISLLTYRILALLKRFAVGYQYA